MVWPSPLLQVPLHAILCPHSVDIHPEGGLLLLLLLSLLLSLLFFSLSLFVYSFYFPFIICSAQCFGSPGVQVDA